MPFNNIADYADYRSEGAWWQSSYFRTTTPVVGVTGRWLDLSVGAGQPVYNAYGGTPKTATPLNNYTNQGAYTGQVPAAGQTKHLHSITVDTTSTSVPSTFVLCDYLMHYPLIDMDDVSEQTMDNTLSLPRYTDGDGVQCFVSVQAPMNGLNINGTCTVKYTNSAGVSNRTTSFSILGSTAIGSIANCGNDIGATAVTTHASPFIPLADNDKGIRSIESITMSAGLGGLCTFVLCYSLGSVPLVTNVTQTEKTFFSRTGRAPRIYDGAFLHFIANNGVANGPTMALFRSSLTFVWG